MSLWAAVLSVSAQEWSRIEKNFTYEGRVVNPSGIPIKDAVVRAIEANVSARTDVNGLFSLTLPEKGDSIVITKEGLATFTGRTIIRTIETPLEIEKVIKKDGGEVIVIKEVSRKIIHEAMCKEVILIGPLETSRMTVTAYAKKMADTAVKYYSAGQKFLSGEGAEGPDYMKAFACFTRAANMEHDQAAYQLAKMYDEGRVIPQDHEKALKWYAKAPGISGVPLRMAIMYMEGIGTPQDDVSARNYLYRAIWQGDSIEAQKLLDELFARHAEPSENTGTAKVDTIPGNADDDRIYDVDETNAEFPGGEAAFYKFINKNLKYPAICQEQGVQGRVIVSFTIEKDGSISDVRAIRSPDPNLSKEAERVIKLMPKWVPAFQGWKPVRSCVHEPVLFRLN